MSASPNIDDFDPEDAWQKVSAQADDFDPDAAWKAAEKPRQYSPEQLAAESERQLTGKRKQFDVAASKDAVIDESKAVAKDFALGAAGAVKSVIPFMDRRDNPAFGESGALATTGNVAGGFVRGALTQAAGTLLTRNKLGGSLALAADRAVQIGREQGWDTFKEHPIATGADVALAAFPGSPLAPGVKKTLPGLLKPIAVDAAAGAGQGAASAVHQGADLSTKEGRSVALKEGLVSGATALGVTAARTALPGVLKPRKETAPNGILEPGAQGQARGQGQVAGQQPNSPTGVERPGDPSSLGPGAASVQGADDPSVAAIKSKIVMDRNEAKASIKDRLNSVLTDVFDQDRPFLLADREAKKLGADLAPSQESYKSFRGLQRRIVSKATGLVDRGWIDDDTGESVTPSLKDVFAPVAGRMDDLAALLVARRAPEMASKQQAFPFSLHDADQTNKRLGSDKALSDAADRYDSVMAGALDYAQKKGFFSSEQVKAIRDENLFYTPWERVDDAGNIVQQAPGAGNKKMSRNPLKRVTAEGSERSIANPLQTSIKNLTSMIAAVEKNEAKRVFADLADIEGMQEWVKPIQGTSKDFAAKAGNVIEVRRNGETQSYQVNPEVAKTLGALSANEQSALNGIMKFQADLQRAGVVLDPSFAANNLLRDSWQQAAVSRTTSIPFANQARGLALMATKKGRETMREWRGSAANQAIEYGAIFSPDELLDKMTAGAERKQLRRFIKYPPAGFKKAMEMAESVGRMGEYDRAKKQSLSSGLSDREARLEAEFQSSDLLDFGMKGRSNIVKLMRRYVPFFGANMSGMYREGAVLRNPTKLAKAIGILGGMEALNYAINQEDSEYWNEPSWKRFAFWRIPTKSMFGADFNIWIPKPPGLLNYGITTPIKSGLETIHQRDPEAAQKNAADALRSMLINITPPAIRTAEELTAGEHGFSKFMDREIVPKKLQGLPARMQFTGRTTEAAKAMSRGADRLGIELSPMKVDYAAQGFLGTLGKKGLGAMDPLFGKKRGEGEGILASMTRRNVAAPGAFGSEVQNRFYDQLAKVDREYRASKVGDIPRIDISQRDAMNQANDQAKELRAQAASAESEQERLRIMKEIDALLAPFVQMPRGY